MFKRYLKLRIREKYYVLEIKSRKWREIFDCLKLKFNFGRSNLLALKLV